MMSFFTVFRVAHFFEPLAFDFEVNFLLAAGMFLDFDIMSFPSVAGA